MGFASANFRTPAKKVDNEERTEEQRQQPPETERYLLQIDRQTKRSFKTPEAARSMGLEIKGRFPALRVCIYDNLAKSRTMVELAKSG